MTMRGEEGDERAPGLQALIVAEPLILSVEDRVGPNKDDVLGRCMLPLQYVDRRGGGATRSWGTTGSGQSISGSSSIGSPSTRIEAPMAVTPSSASTKLKLNSFGEVGSNKRKRVQRASGPDKGNRGLRQFSMKVCEKVESKGRTTYNEL
nr:transcription factor-like protein DPB [Tanacetum cinerariifolium]